MGTFHQDKSPLHGITLVIETLQGDAIVGRCDDENETEVILLDADIHRTSDEMSRAEYLDRADRFGVWPKHGRVLIRWADVAGQWPLGERPDSESQGTEPARLETSKLETQ